MQIVTSSNVRTDEARTAYMLRTIKIINNTNNVKRQMRLMKAHHSTKWACDVFNRLLVRTHWRYSKYYAQTHKHFCWQYTVDIFETLEKSWPPSVINKQKASLLRGMSRWQVTIMCVCVYEYLCVSSSLKHTFLLLVVCVWLSTHTHIHAQNGRIQRKINAHSKIRKSGQSQCCVYIKKTPGDTSKEIL